MRPALEKPKGEQPVYSDGWHGGAVGSFQHQPGLATNRQVFNQPEEEEEDQL